MAVELGNTLRAVDCAERTLVELCEERPHREHAVGCGRREHVLHDREVCSRLEERLPERGRHRRRKREIVARPHVCAVEHSLKRRERDARHVERRLELLDQRRNHCCVVLDELGRVHKRRSVRDEPGAQRSVGARGVCLRVLHVDVDKRESLRRSRVVREHRLDHGHRRGHHTRRHVALEHNLRRLECVCKKLAVANIRGPERRSVRQLLLDAELRELPGVAVACVDLGPGDWHEPVESVGPRG
eukprot:Amastigsp_a842159_22.p2 type:complete len:244 gc:universal Amastigsp_a842159_22:210-941(+)